MTIHVEASRETELADTLAAVAEGDIDAYRRLYERTCAKLFAIVRGVLRDEATAEEVLQEVYLRIWRNAASYSPEIARPMTWMITIARNRAIDVARQRVETTVAPDEDGGDWLDSVADPRNDTESVVARESLRQCLGVLDETQRACIVAAYCGGYSREELAARYDKPVNTIKTWLKRGPTSLRNCLGSP
ncbi:MAG: sigma-70 family RNA polymerase sigma factor [Salinarimonadaceae bacterium]|nr:MAG: sigma-70 family RNA polymerase sigma factor [Salinarimonadaceae bacterium]